MVNLIKLLPSKFFVSAKVVKAALAFFLLACMVVNNFVPRNIENKETILQIIGTAVNNVVVETFRDCTQTLVAMSNKIMNDLYKFLNMDETSASAGPLEKKDNKNETSANSSNDLGIFAPNRQSAEAAGSYQMQAVSGLTAGKISEELYKLYCRLKVFCSGGENIGILLPVLFILVIVRRKFWLNNFVNGFAWIKGKTNLC